jgi:hypothetical protein
LAFSPPDVLELEKVLLEKVVKGLEVEVDVYQI